MVTMVTIEALWQTLDKTILQFKGYKESLNELSKLPRGYALCFAFHYVNADILNGGLSQLYSNPTWSLLLTAIEACSKARASKIEYLLKEILMFYHQKGRSRFKRQLTEGFFADIEHPMTKSLSELEDEYYALDQDRDMVITMLLNDATLWK